MLLDGGKSTGEVKYKVANELNRYLLYHELHLQVRRTCRADEPYYQKYNNDDDSVFCSSCDFVGKTLVRGLRCAQFSCSCPTLGTPKKLLACARSSASYMQMSHVE